MTKKGMLRPRVTAFTQHDIKVRVITALHGPSPDPEKRGEYTLLHHSKVDIPAIDIQDAMNIAAQMRHASATHPKSDEISRSAEVFVRVYMQQYSMGYADFPVEQMAGIIGLLDKVYKDVVEYKRGSPYAKVARVNVDDEVELED